MPGPAAGGAFSTFNATQDKALDGLLMGVRWGDGASAPVTITYSFPTAQSVWWTSVSTGYGPASGNKEPWNDLKGLTAAQQQAVRDIFAMLGSYASIDFVEIEESVTNVGDLRIAFSGAVADDAVAHTYTPDGMLLPAGVGSAFSYAGDVWLNADDYASFNPVPGSYDYHTLVHEIGHALGLKHPFEQEGSFSFLPAALDSYDSTVMSYSPRVGMQNLWMPVFPTTFMPLDVAALQHLYGRNDDFRSGNDNYTFKADGSYNKVLWDTGGVDTLRFESASAGAVIDLTPGSWQQLGTPLAYYADLGGAPVATRAETVFILDGVIIENAFGGYGSDTITGNAAGNMLAGGGGNDALYGGDGGDWLLGGAGNDTLDGGTGANRLDGDAGSDVYIVRSDDDIIDESLIAGNDVDTVQCYLNDYLLPDDIENLVILATGDSYIIGNDANNRIFSGGGNCYIDGDAGNDTIDYSLAAKAVKVDLALSSPQVTGGAGLDTLISIENLVGSKHNDKLAGDDGANRILGGEGRDLITGGGGADVFVFANLVESSVSDPDTIADFAIGVDRIDLSALDANQATAANEAFTGFIHTNAEFSAAGQLKLAGGILYANTDADSAAEFALKLTGVAKLVLGDLVV